MPIVLLLALLLCFSSSILLTLLRKEHTFPKFTPEIFRNKESRRFFQKVSRRCGRTLFFLLLFLLVNHFSIPLFSWEGLSLLFFVGLFYAYFAEILPRKASAGSFLQNGALLPLLLFLPVTYPLYALSRLFEKKSVEAHLSESELQIKKELVELIQSSDTGSHLAPEDKEMIESVVTFPNRIAREVMVPRVSIFALPAKTTIKEAAQKCIEEGYSRVPVYKNSIDEILGILMFKDLLLFYMNGKEALHKPVETLVKKTLYTPETQKISRLLQEFKKRQQHMAVVVDEYGGTEGIVTIEDILEEIVGEIADEYDEDEELYFQVSPGCWIVKTRMTIIDLEEELDVEIPQEGEYDTISGYIFHKAGAIPEKGFSIDHDNFKLDVLRTNERGVEKVRLTKKNSP